MLIRNLAITDRLRVSGSAELLYTFD